MSALCFSVCVLVEAVLKHSVEGSRVIRLEYSQYFMWMCIRNNNNKYYNNNTHKYWEKRIKTQKGYLWKTTVKVWKEKKEASPISVLKIVQTFTRIYFLFIWNIFDILTCYSSYRISLFSYLFLLRLKGHEVEKGKMVRFRFHVNGTGKASQHWFQIFGNLLKKMFHICFQEQCANK